MDFKLKDLGKIKKADIKLDGITVICGDNNTGKSTICLLYTSDAADEL